MKLITHYRKGTNSFDKDIVNWRENHLGESLFYSRRETYYTQKNFPSRLHYHDYYELVIFEEGDIYYICEADTYTPKTGDILLIPPGNFHMSAINCKGTLYKRHVFYMYPDALDSFDCGTLTSFLANAKNGICIISMENEQKKELLSLANKLDDALEKGKEDPAYKALAKGLCIQIFFLLCKNTSVYPENHRHLPANILKIKKYIDENYLDLSSSSDVAVHFFYSREYIARIFRKYFNTTVSEYIKERRIFHSTSLLDKGLSVSEACFASGFENMSTFIRSFKSVLNMTPSEYRKNPSKTNM
ncbi:MAG: helix-turn-helix domain-containing protein [Clostridia bacterium]|nr:helix-turn-helix domain-containing protein [Clostridia bacterium]